MSKFTTSYDIKAKIAELEAESKRIENDMKDRLANIYEGLKPSNAIKAAFRQVTSSPDVGTELLNAAANIAAGYLGTRFLWGTKNGVIKRVAGAALQMGAGTNIVKKAGVWKRFATSLFKKDNKNKIRPETISYEPVENGGV